MNKKTEQKKETQREKLIKRIKDVGSCLCVGLDLDQSKFPSFMSGPGSFLHGCVVEYAIRIIEQTCEYVAAYKPNRAFFEAMGSQGIMALNGIYTYLRDYHPDILIIDDAKRGDIGNSAKMYAKGSFEMLCADAITVAPYMGRDSVQPFLDYEDKWTILLALTSNAGSNNFQMKKVECSDELVPNMNLYEDVITQAVTWASPKQLMFVVGATKAEMLTRIREIAPDNFLLIPGVGKQGGNLDAVLELGMNDDCGILVNASRSIIYPEDEPSHQFAKKAGEEAQRMQRVMAEAMAKKGII